MAAQQNGVETTPKPEKERPWNADWRARQREGYRQLTVDSIRYAMMPSAFDAELLDGDQNRRSFADLIETNTGQVTFVYFWNQTCPPCMKTLPKLLKLERQYKDKDVDFVYLNLSDPEPKWSDYNKRTRMNERPHSYHITNRTEAPLVINAAVYSVPGLLLFDRQGRLCEIKLPRPGEGLEAYINELLEY
jgi:thiol-disulfide isomerase/thioredoxin